MTEQVHEEKTREQIDRETAEENRKLLENAVPLIDTLHGVEVLDLSHPDNAELAKALENRNVEGRR